MRVQSPAYARPHVQVSKWIAAAGVAALLVFAGILYLALHWPFTEAAVIQSLAEASSSKVEIGSFRSTYFPHPGCVATNVIFHYGSRSDIPPLITIQQMTVRSSFFGLLRKHVQLMKVDGLQIFIPQTSNEKFRSKTNAVIDELTTSNASLKFETSGKPKVFEIHEADLRNVGGIGGMPFQVRLANPTPPGEIQASGSFGPWIVGHGERTKVSGKYTFERADLGVFKGIAGTLSSNGTFDGTLDHIGVQGSIDTQDFTVTSSSHKTELRSQFQAVVNAKRGGDVSLERVLSQLRRTEILAKGAIVGQAGEPGKTAALDFYSRNGRIQDLLLLFATDERAPMSGVTNLRAHVILPPQNRPFLRKVRLTGDFGIDAGKFTAPAVQEDTNKLSAEARDQNDRNPGTVLSNLRGHVEVKDGTATFSNLSFGIPGALAEMHGTYELVSEKIDLHGTLKMDSSLSNLAHGPKALILVVLDPFFKRHKEKGSKVPVKITGTYEHPLFGLDLEGHKKTETGKRLERMYRTPRK
jgi:hypothetical protein